MPAYIPGITNRAIRGLQIRTRGITNKGGMKGFQIRTKRLQIGAKKFKLGERLQIWARTITNRGRDYKSLQNTMLCVEGFLSYISLILLVFTIPNNFYLLLLLLSSFFF